MTMNEQQRVMTMNEQLSSNEVVAYLDRMFTADTESLEVRGGEWKAVRAEIERLQKDLYAAQGSLAALRLEKHGAIRRTPDETSDALDAARYRFMRQPGNAIVYAKDRDAWGEGHSGHVRCSTPEQLDAAIDKARAAVEATDGH
jgi:hypothetical protein